MNINRDQVEGKIKEAAGALTGDVKLEDEGKADQLAGDAKSVVQDVADKAAGVIDDVKDAIAND